MKHRVHKTFRHVLLPALLAILVSGCTTMGPPVNTAERQAERLAAAGDHAGAASEYIGLAGSAEGEARRRLTLLAVEQWLEAGDGRRARNALRRIPAPEQGEMLWLWSSNAAALALWEGRPDDALALLEPLSRMSLPQAYRLRVQALHADAWFQKDDPIRAVQLYGQRENWLNNSADIRRNRQQLWAGLQVSRPQVLRRASDMTDDPELLGWLRLGTLAASTGQQGIGWGSGARRWLEDYPGHPAAALLDNLDLPDIGEQGYPRQVALLLPLSGSNAAAGRAVQNGFFAAYFANSTELASEQQVRVYDSTAGALSAYQQAVTDGAEFVVGPLLRNRVSELARDQILPVPLLTLNYLPDNIAAPPGFWQFALSPEDEAVAAAERALQDGHRYALALVPRNDWGRRLANSFASAFEAGGGTLLEARDYEAGKQDFSFEIENLMLLSHSVQRYQRLRANIGGPLQFDPRRRQDADFIFLAATAPVGRLLKSQLKFHYAGDLPVYSTSRIHAMDGRSNSDLNGVMFADTPWVISPQPWIADLPPLFSEHWPAQRRLGRLHALGYDAWHLVPSLYASRIDAIPEIDGATGRLWIDGDGRVHRKLAWARFERGEAMAMPALERLPELEEDAPADSENPGDVTWIDRSSGGT